MDDEVQHLVLAPFQEIVEKSKTALENAKDAEPLTSQEMHKAAQSLLREGQRALKRIEPLCKKNVEHYGPNFVDALKENEDITKIRAELNDVLWDFDSFVEADDFDAEEFAKLQALSRKLAPQAYDILMRMKLEHPSIPDYLSVGTRSWGTSVAGFSDGPAGGTEQPREEAVESPDPLPVDRSRIARMMGAEHSQDQAARVSLPTEHTDSRETYVPSPTSEAEPPPVPSRSTQRPDAIRHEDTPPEPPINPWQLNRKATMPDDIRSPETVQSIERRGHLAYLENDSATVLPLALPGRADSQSSGTTHEMPRRDYAATRKTSEGGRSPHRTAAMQNSAGIRAEGLNGNHWQPGNNNTTVMAPVRGSRSPSTPIAMLDGANGRRPPSAYSSESGYSLITNFPAPPMHGHAHSKTSSSSSVHPSVFEYGAMDGFVSPSTDPRTSFPAVSEPSPLNDNPGRDVFPPIPETPPPAMSAVWTSRPHPMQPIPIGRPASIDQPGLEPVQISVEAGVLPPNGEWSSRHGPAQLPLREIDCSITVDSSFYMLKGFCEGAKEITRGGVGVKKIQKTSMGTGIAVAAKCKNCMFELDWNEVELDVNKSEDANYKNTGVGFRLRFLSKSHLPARHIEDQMYGCPLCVQLGKTTEPSDATVFFSQKQLFAHLARHPRPLPNVPGFHIFEGADIPQQHRNNYDLYFSNPPIRSLMPGLSRELANLPMAVATDTFRKLNGSLRTPPGNQPVLVLQFAAGARIVGIEFPAKYGGEWAIGWADNTRGTFPAEMVRLIPPEQTIMAQQMPSGAGTNNLRAVARWKRSPKDKDGGAWLRFEKGEAIVGISFPFQEYWCWSGYNSKKKWGIFPQSYMEPGTLSDTMSSDRGFKSSSLTPHGDGTNMNGHETKAGGVLGKLVSMRRKDTRPLMTDSYGSDETLTPHSPRPSLY